MNYTDVNISIIPIIEYGINKKDPVYYCYMTKTIIIREDYYKQMRKSCPLSIHWFYHAFACHMLATKFGKDWIIKSTGTYPDTHIERMAFAYQFYFLMETRTINSIEELYTKDQFFKHKKIYSNSLNYYWNNAHFIIQEFNNR